jgi:hypothetical protein
MSEWVRGRKSGAVSAAVYAMLAKCRAMAHMRKQAQNQTAAGNDLKAATLNARAARGLSGKARLEKAMQLRSERRAKAEKPTPSGDGFNLKRESTAGKKTFKPTNEGAGRTGTMFDMKRGDLPGQTSLMDRFGTVHTHKPAEPKPAPVPAPAKAAKPPAKPPVPKADVAAIRAEVKQLHDRAGHASTTIEAIDALKPKLAAMTKADLVSVSSAVGMVEMGSKSRQAIADQIVDRIRSIKQSQLRVGLVDRPKGATTSGEGKAAAGHHLRDVMSRAHEMDAGHIDREVDRLATLSTRDLKAVQKDFLGANLGNSRAEMLGHIKKQIHDNRRSSLRTKQILEY